MYQNGNLEVQGRRYAGRNARYDRERRERQQAIETAEKALDDARAAYEDESVETPGRPAWRAYQAARDALFTVDPKNPIFTD